MYDVAIIGAGITGCSIAYELGKYNVNAVVIEKENDVAVGTTKANSAIIHGGYDPIPGSLMAKYNIRGNQYIKELCKKLDVPFKQIGALIVAFEEKEEKTLEELKQRGEKNGVPDMEIWDQETLRKEEPNISEKAIKALFSPNVGIISPWELAIALGEMAALNGVEFKLNTEVTDIKKNNDSYEIKTNNGTVEAKYICNAAGVNADKVNEYTNKKSFTIKPNKGEYYLLDKSQGELVNHVIFQCPNKDGKGVLVSPTVHGNLITKEDDFFIFEDEENKGFFNISGMASPGLSSAPAIAVDLLKMMEESGLCLEAKKEIKDERKVNRFKKLSDEERAALIKENPLYGKIICRCETVTEGEIVDAIHRPIPATSIDAVKRRCNAGMGRCQGGFCGPRVQEIISRELNIPLEDVPQDRVGMNIITGETKTGGAR